MKKIYLLTTCIALITATAFAAPQTDIKKGETAIDIGVISPKEALSGWDFPGKSNPDIGITSGLSDRYALQYKYHGLTSKEHITSNPLTNEHLELNTQELNILYKLSKNTDVFIGVNRLQGDDIEPIRTLSYETKNTFQYGITSKIPLGNNIDAWGTVATGSDLLSCELGVSKSLSKNTDLNLYYRYMENKNINLKHFIPFDFESNGFGLGITMKF